MDAHYVFHVREVAIAGIRGVRNTLVSKEREEIVIPMHHGEVRPPHAIVGV